MRIRRPQFFSRFSPYFRDLGKKMITTVVLTLTAGGTLWAYAAFVEPTSGPADSTQDFAQDILGANSADNGFDSSAVVANKDGSIIERLEYIGNPTCGNSIVEIGEGCDDGNTSWTSGACAGDCSKRNYWSQPKWEGDFVGTWAAAANNWCVFEGFKNATSYLSTYSGNLYTTSAYTSMNSWNKYVVNGMMPGVHFDTIWLWHNNSSVSTAAGAIMSYRTTWYSGCCSYYSSYSQWVRAFFGNGEYFKSQYEVGYYYVSSGSYSISNTWTYSGNYTAYLSEVWCTD